MLPLEVCPYVEKLDIWALKLSVKGCQSECLPVGDFRALFAAIWQPPPYLLTRLELVGSFLPFVLPVDVV